MLGHIYLQLLMQAKLMLPHGLQHPKILLKRSGARTDGQDRSLLKLCDSPLNHRLVIKPQPTKHSTEELSTVGSTETDASLRQARAPSTIENPPTKEDIQEHLVQAA
jgi:hypothetical protein